MRGQADKDCPVLSSERLVSVRERQVVELLSKLALASGAQIRRVCFAQEKVGRGDPQVPRRVLLRMTRAGILARLDRRIGGVKGGSEGYVYRLAPRGQRLAARWSDAGQPNGRSAPEPGERFLAHRLAVTETFVRLHEAEQEGRLKLVEFEGEPACWRSFTAPLRGPITLKPDAFLRVICRELELLWFVEVDRGTVSQATRRRQADAYRAYWQALNLGEVMPRVLWLTLGTAIAARAAAAVNLAAEPRGLFTITENARAVQTAIDPGGRA